MRALDPSEGWMNEEGRMRGGAGRVPRTAGRRRAKPRIEQLLLAGEKAACLRVIQPELRLLLSITEFGMLPELYSLKN
jgi:hypothetical protein